VRSATKEACCRIGNGLATRQENHARETRQTRKKGHFHFRVFRVFGGKNRFIEYGTNMARETRQTREKKNPRFVFF